MSLGMSADAAHWSLPELSWYLCVGAATAHTSSSVTGSSICCWWPRITGENEMSRLELYRSLCSPWFRSQCSLAKFARSFVLSGLCFGFLLGVRMSIAGLHTSFWDRGRKNISCLSRALYASVADLVFFTLRADGERVRGGCESLGLVVAVLIGVAALVMSTVTCVSDFIARTLCLHPMRFCSSSLSSSHDHFGDTSISRSPSDLLSNM